jgi:hypothetical protein
MRLVERVQESGIREYHHGGTECTEMEGAKKFLNKEPRNPGSQEEMRGWKMENG